MLYDRLPYGGQRHPPRWWVYGLPLSAASGSRCHDARTAAGDGSGGSRGGVGVGGGGGSRGGGGGGGGGGGNSPPLLLVAGRLRILCAPGMDA